jgi:hypothetical protein
MIGYKFLKGEIENTGYKYHNDLLLKLTDSNWVEIVADEDCSSFSVIISHNFQRSLFKNINCPFIQITNNQLIQNFEIINDETVHYITHYMSSYNKLKSVMNKTKIYFLPMVIEPFSKENDKEIEEFVNKTYKKTSDVIWFGNVYRQKIETFNDLKEKIKFDIISFNSFNEIEIKHDRFNKRDILKHILKRYDIGIGVGKCAQEMLSLNMKVLIIGTNIGGFILTQKDFDFHIKQNCNSSISNSLGSIEKDIEYVSNHERKKINLPSFNEYLFFIKNLIEKLDNNTK